MAFRSRQRRYRRKPAYRRKRIMKRTRARLALNVHRFKRKVVLGNIIALNNGGATTNAATAFSFKLTDLPQYTDFTNLFDQYKITGVKLDFIPFADNVSWEVASNGAAVSAPGGPLMIAADYDDVSVPASASDMLSRQNVKVVPVGRRYQMFIRPKFNDVANSTTVVPARGFIDCDTATAPHYGIKCWMAAPNVSNTSFTYQVWATYYVTLKGVI